MEPVNQMVLLADIREVISIIMALLVPVLWVVKQIADAKRAKGPEAQPAAAPPAAPPQPPRQAAGQQADPLRNQVEEFLRRAGRGPQVDQPRPAPRDIEVLIDEPPVGSAPRGEPMPRPAVPAKPVAAAPSPPATSSSPPTPSRPPRRSVIPRKRKSLAERATERAAVRASRIAAQTSHLGQRIIEDDQQFDVQLKAKFDHTVGTLAESARPAAEPVPRETPAGQIAAMLATPDGVRQAIVVNEILRRPVDRW
jgi:hypothetical protein